jgi:FKBP-type peptidyl-prolyl cis-trans isomerase
MSTFATETENLSYALGMNMAHYLSSQPVPVDPSVVLRAIAETLANKAQLTNDEYASAMQTLQNKMREAGEAELARLKKVNAEAAAKFLLENSAKDGVVSTASGLQYQIIEAGSGAKPAATSKVKVNYTGTLLDGMVFDTTVNRGPAEFGVNQVIPGWQEGLQLMSVGSKFKFFIPPALGYGERGAGQRIQPNSLLIFEVELLEIL